MRARGTLAFVAAGLVAVVAGCNSSQVCCGGCPGSEAAVFYLACSSTDLRAVVATGSCATDASLFSYRGNESVAVAGQSPGVCHVELTFATGFTYSTDVTFATQSGGVCGGPQCKCPDYLAPTSGPFTVGDPTNTCVDSGVDAAEGGVAMTCPASATESAACVSPATCSGCRDNVRFECACGDVDAPGVDGGSLEWQCVDTGMPCTGGS